MHTLNPITLALALSRAQVQPFTPDLWAAYCDAVGDAHSVVFHAEDRAQLVKQLGIQHWDPDTTLVILDDGGLTWCGYSTVNGMAWQVNVELQVGTYDPGLPGEYWQVSDRYVGLELEAEYAALPPEQRSLVLACPEQARPHVLAGIRQAKAALAAEQQEQQPGSELVHDWTKG